MADIPNLEEEYRERRNLRQNRGPASPIHRETTSNRGVGWVVATIVILAFGALGIQWLVSSANEAQQQEAANRAQAVEQARRAEANRVEERKRVEQAFLGEWYYTNRTNGQLAKVRISRQGDSFSGEYQSGEHHEPLSGQLQADNRLRLINTRQYGKIVRPFTWYEGDFSHEAWLQLGNDGTVLFVSFASGGPTVVMKRIPNGALGVMNGDSLVETPFVQTDESNSTDTAGTRSNSEPEPELADNTINSTLNIAEEEPRRTLETIKANSELLVIPYPAELIVKTLKLPQEFKREINAANYDSYGKQHPCYKLQREGYITMSRHGAWLDYDLSVTEKGSRYYLGEGKYRNGSNTLLFKTFDIDFNEIIGIAFNQEQRTATIRFSLKAINITPIGRILENNIDNHQNGELVFKKFDTGWRLAYGQTISRTELVREIFWSQKK